MQFSNYNAFHRTRTMLSTGILLSPRWNCGQCARRARRGGGGGGEGGHAGRAGGRESAAHAAPPRPKCSPVSRSEVDPAAAERYWVVNLWRGCNTRRRATSFGIASWSRWRRRASCLVGRSAAGAEQQPVPPIPKGGGGSGRDVRRAEAAGGGKPHARQGDQLLAPSSSLCRPFRKGGEAAAGM
jgi:hypothetical protein